MSVASLLMSSESNLREQAQYEGCTGMKVSCNSTVFQLSSLVHKCEDYEYINLLKLN